MKITEKIKQLSRGKIVFSFAFAGLGILFILLCFALWSKKPLAFLQYRDIPLSKQRQTLSSSLVVAERNDSISFFRPADGKEETLAGGWRFLFLDPTATALYGFFKEKPDQQHLYYLTTRGSMQKDISRFPGAIYEIDRSPGKNFLVFRGIKNSTKNKQPEIFSCLAKVTTLPSDACLELPKSVLDKKIYSDKIAYNFSWNKNKTSELIVKEMNKPNRIFAYDADQALTRQVDDSYLPAQEASSTPAQNPFEIKHYPLVTKITNRLTKQSQYFFLSEDTAIYWVNTGTLLAVKGRESYLINFYTRERSKFATFPADNPVISTYFSDLKNWPR